MNEWRKLTEELANEGIFFQRKCAQLIKQAGWRVVSEESPVAFPPAKISSIERMESITDIKAQCETFMIDNRFISVTSAVECKQRNPKYRCWVFFEASETVTSHPCFLAYLIYDTERLDVEPKSVIVELGFPDLGYPLGDRQQIYSDKREINRSDKSAKICKNREGDSIYKACKQVAVATKAFFHDEFDFASKLHAIGAALGIPYTVFIPIVLTAAELWVCKFDSTDISIKNGQLESSKVAYRRAPWLIYTFPLPSYLRPTPEKFIVHPDSQGREVLTKMDMFIVNSSHCLDFFEKLKKIGFDRQATLFGYPETRDR